jgi:hypothetical protein
VQATKRQRLSDLVYIAIPKPSYKLKSKRWTDICHLVRRLELGLIIVSFSGNRKTVEVIFHPVDFNRKKSMNQNKRKRDALLKEINGRSADFNVGGSNKTKIMTAYKENCVKIACYLQNLGTASPRKLVKLGTGDKTSAILSKNYYGWFDRVSRGVYVLSEKGKREIQEYPDLLSYYYKKFEAIDQKIDG